MKKVNIEVERIETRSLNARINYIPSPFQKHTSCNTCEHKPFCVNIIFLL